VTTLQF